MNRSLRHLCLSHAWGVYSAVSIDVTNHCGADLLTVNSCWKLPGSQTTKIKQCFEYLLERFSVKRIGVSGCPEVPHRFWPAFEPFLTCNHPIEELSIRGPNPQNHPIIAKLIIAFRTTITNLRIPLTLSFEDNYVIDAISCCDQLR